MNTDNKGNNMYDVVVIENAFVDVLASGVKEADLVALGLKKGTSCMTNGRAPIISKFLAKYGLMIKPGGSGANVAAHAAGAGARTAFMGTIGNDEHGRVVEAGFRNANVDSFLKIDSGNTGGCHSLITEDGERTMALDPGNALNFGVNDLNVSVVERARFLHTSMYALADNPQREAALLALKIARKSGGKTSLDLANAPLVSSAKEFILELLASQINIVVANEEEAKALFGSIAEAQRVLPGICETSIIKLGSKGSIITHNHEVFKIPVFPARVVDTTGAGDSYIGTYLAHIAQGANVEEAGIAASKKAAEIVGRIGAR